MRKLSILLVAATAFSALASSNASAATDVQCEAYTETAIAQFYHMKQVKACKLPTSNRWHADYVRHYSWCKTAKMSQLQKESNIRAEHLLNCSGDFDY